MRLQYLLLLALVLLISACNRDKSNHKAVVPSPGFDVHLYFNLFNGSPFFLVYYEDSKIMNWSRLGFNPSGNQKMVFEDDNGNAGIGRDNGDGVTSFFRDLKYNERSVRLSYERDPDLAYTIDFRAFNGGVAYRYRFDSQEVRSALLAFEKTEFHFIDNHTGWEGAAPGDTVPTDAFYLPVELMSGQGHSIKIFEDPGVAGPPLQFRQQAGSSTAYSLLYSSGGAVEQARAEALVTPWRIMLISKRKDNE